MAILHTVYAVYHLSRSSKGRTPASSASYMLFAAIVDVSLIPFYAFSALMARQEYTESPSPDRWQTLFNDDSITYKIVYSTFLISVTCGGLHLVSCIMSLYLGVLFRKISRLPPDMNPLEDNLTSRHKRNKSSLLDNRTSQASTANLNNSSGVKVDDPLISPVRSVPFMHTRNDSQTKISDVPHPKDSPRSSRFDVSAPFYSQPSSARNSRVHEPSNNGLAMRQTPLHLASQTHFPALTTQNQQPTIPTLIPQSEPSKSPPRKQIFQSRSQGITRSPTKSSSIYSTDTTTATNTTFNVRPSSVVPSLLDSNWITHPSPSSSPSPSPPRELRHLVQKTSYQPLAQTSPFEYTANNENQPPTMGNPLEMNPPTPPVDQWKHRPADSGQRALTAASGNAKPQGNWFQGPGIVGIGKARAWGGMGQPAGRPNGGGRVISRSGVEVRGGILPSGGVRAREVSGKVMEEGRGKNNWDLVRD